MPPRCHQGVTSCHTVSKGYTRCHKVTQGIIRCQVFLEATVCIYGSTLVTKNCI